MPGKIGMGMTPRQTEPQTELAKLIRSRREELGLTRQQFAEKAGYHPMTIGYLETRGQKVSGEKVGGLLKALQLDLLDFKRFIFSNLKETESPLGQLVRFRRLERGLSLKALAKKIGKTPQYISLIELGQIPLSENKSMIKRIAKALDMDLALLEAVRPKRKLKIREELDLNTLGGFITQKRLELNLTLRQVAERAKTTAGTLSCIETNKYKHGPELLARIANTLECEIPTRFSKLN